MVVPFRVRMVGPLEPFASGFGAELTRLGYTPRAACKQVELAAHLSRWLAEHRLDATVLTPSTVDSYLAARRAAGYRTFRSPKALQPLLAYLRRLGVAPVVVTDTAAMPVEGLLERYRRYLLVERGLVDRAARGYVDLVRPFVTARVDAGGPATVTAGEVSAFLVAESRRLAPKTLQRLTTALRSLLRFWHLDGVVDVSLVTVVPKVAHRPAGLPHGLPPAHVDALLASCDRTTAAGLRDYAMLTLLARLGLRCAEVAGLQLDDLDWRAGEILVRGKRNRQDRLPLPVDVGQCLVAYLRGARPPDALDRGVFIRVHAPRRGLTAGGVTQAVAGASHRAGLGTIYGHRLRHSAATSMLTAGASLAEIGQVLRHRRVLTTSGYAKVDTAMLRTLARPWPTAGVS
jgi:site-specific recombinase XerD